MLAVTRDQIFEYLHTLEQDWREDHTNQDACRDRARLRRDVLPVLEDMHPGVAPKATALCDHLHDVAALLDDAVQRHAQLMVHHISDSFVQLDRRQARDMNQAVFIGLLRQLLEQQGVPADRLGLRSVEPILRAARDSHGGSRTFMFQGHVRLRLTRNAIIIERI